MCRSLFVIIRENCKIVFRQGAYAAVIFLFLIPYLHGIPNLNSEKVAGCLGQLVSLIGMPLFVSILKPEQDSDIRDIINIKSFSYYTSIFLRMIFAIFLSFILIYIFALYMLYQGCKFPINIYVVRTVEVSALIGGAGLLVSAMFRKTLAGILVSVGFVFLFYNDFMAMVFDGLPGFVKVIEILLYSIILLLCNKY